MKNALQNRECEVGVIGSCLLGGLKTTLEAMETVTVECFTQQDCLEAWLVLTAIGSRNQEIRLETFAVEWPKHSKAHMPPVILESVEQVPSAANLSYYTKELIQTWRRREVAYAGSMLTKLASDPTKDTDEVIAEAEQILLRHRLEKTRMVEGLAGARELTDYLEETAALHQAGKRSGISTGFTWYDRLTDGIHGTELTILAARPSVGKTALALNITQRACIEDGHPTLFITLEMSSRALLRRLCASWSQIPLKELRTGTWTEDRLKAAKIVSFFTVLKKSQLYIFEAISGVNSERMMAVIRRMVHLKKIKLVVVDYLQKIKPTERHEKRTYEVAQVSGDLKAVAVQCDVAVLALAQLNRDSEKDKPRPPRLTDLADSGQIERDADVVALLHRNRGEDEGRKAGLFVAKQRDGEIGPVALDFDGSLCRFSNPTDL